MLRNFVGVRPYSFRKTRVKSKGARYPSSAAITFIGNVVPINCSIARIKRFFFLNSLRP